MNYDRLTLGYWRNQIERVVNSLGRLGTSQVTGGRVVPSDTSLALGQGRRLSMAIMFLDISGFSQRLSSTAPEQETVMKTLNLFFTEMIRISEDYGGVIEKNTGDGLMVYFKDGEEDPPEDGAKRAVACALTMMDAGNYLINPVLRRAAIADMQFRISIDHGPVTIAKLGAPQRFGGIVAVGAAANVASKMLSLADAGDIVIGENLQKRLPLEWKVLWTQLVPKESGWTYRLTGVPYSIYRYTGRWTNPR